MRNTLLFILFLGLFGGTNVWYNLGIPLYHAESLLFVNPVFVLTMLATVFMFLSNNQTNVFFIIKQKRQEVRFILLLVTVVIHSLLNGFGGINILFNIFFFPLFFLILLIGCDKRFFLKARKLILIFYIINCVIAIFERLVGRHLFDLDPYIFSLDLCYSPFRSTALQNHPLNNALLTSVILLFIIMSNMSLRQRYLYASLGFVSILCYGARSSLLLWGVLLPILVIRELFFTHKQYSLPNKIIFLISICFIVGTVYYLLTDTMFGERIMSVAEFDGSAGTRLTSLEALAHFDIQDLLWGYRGYNILVNRLDLHSIENFYIIWIIRYGLVFTILLLVFSFLIVHKYTREYPVFIRYFIFGAFLLLASTNNSLATDTFVTILYPLCAISFKPLYIHRK